MPVNTIQRHSHNGLDSEKIDFDNLKDIPSVLDTLSTSAPQSAITAPSGGLTVDSEARTAINAIITRLETLGLIEEN